MIDFDILKVFAKNLRRIRKSNGFTQAMLANAVGVEISQISGIERGVINTSVLMLINIPKALGINRKDLFDF